MLEADTWEFGANSSNRLLVSTRSSLLAPLIADHSSERFRL